MNRLPLLMFVLLLIGCQREDTKPPKVQFLSPESDIVVFERDTVPISIDATDNDEVFEVKLLLNEQEIYSSHTPPYTYNLLTKGRIGENVIKATALDPSGNVGESKMKLITVLANKKPTASFTVTPEFGVINEDVTVNCSGSSDSEDALSELFFRWDWESDGVWDTDYSHTIEATHKYDNQGKHIISLQVKDQQNNTNITSLEVTIRGLFTDPRDGTEYQTINIGGKTWFAENLNFTSSVNSWCYANSNGNCDQYGRLYLWSEGINSCPDGWHLSTEYEWSLLEKELGMSESDLDKLGDRNSGEVGKKLKAKEGWGSSFPGLDSYGFSALSAGYAEEGNNVVFFDMGQVTSYWIAEIANQKQVLRRSLSTSNDGINKNYTGLQKGFSVRCVEGISEPVVYTDEIKELEGSSATVSLYAYSGGGEAITEVGLCWGRNESPTIDDNKISTGQTIGASEGLITGLVPNSTYYVRAYAINSSQVGYGNQITIQTPVILPTVFTGGVSSITSTGVICAGEVISDGYGSLSSVGICWSKNDNPTLETNYMNAPNGVGTYTCQLNNLNPNTTYYYRAFASNEVGTAYGGIETFKTITAIPKISTQVPFSITQHSAVIGGHIISDGGLTVSEKGVCINTEGNPTVNDLSYSIPSIENPFSIKIEGLNLATEYFVKAYAINREGLAYGQQVTFKTRNDSSTMTDSRDGQVYSTVKIGEAWWMSKNLNYSGVTSWCYEETSQNCDIYGRLYTWSNAKIACPEGWHLPDDTEWKVLELELEMDSGEVDNDGYRGSGEVGNALKSIDLWEGLDQGNNSSGFNALPAGSRHIHGSFFYKGTGAILWTDTESNAIDAWFRYIKNVEAGVYRNPGDKLQARSVRCIKDN